MARAFHVCELFSAAAATVTEACNTAPNSQGSLVCSHLHLPSLPLTWMLRHIAPLRRTFRTSYLTHEPSSRSTFPIRTASTTRPTSRLLPRPSIRYASTMPSSAKPSEAYGNFDLIAKTKLDYTDVLISKWKSRETGLSVVHLDYEGTPHHRMITFGTISCGAKLLIG